MSENLNQIEASIEKIISFTEDLIASIDENDVDRNRFSFDFRKAVDEAFPLVRSFAEDPENVWNTDYKLCSERFRNLIDWIFHAINRPYYDIMDNFPEAVRDECWKIVDSFHLLIAFSKRVEKYPKDLEIVQKWLSLVDAFLPVALFMKKLKSEGKVKKGRKPLASAKPSSSSFNQNKIVKTCPCCFRSIAVRMRKTKDGEEFGEIVNHGYHRPGWGFLTQGCIGVGFPALEDSPKGLEHLLDVLQKTLLSKENELRDTDWDQKVFTIKPSPLSFRVRESKESVKPKEIRLGDPRFDAMKRRSIKECESTITSLKQDIECYKKILSTWETEWKGKPTKNI